MFGQSISQLINDMFGYKDKFLGWKKKLFSKANYLTMTTKCYPHNIIFEYFNFFVTCGRNVQYSNWYFLQLFLCTPDTPAISCSSQVLFCEKWLSFKKRELIDYMCLCAKLRNQIKFSKCSFYSCFRCERSTCIWYRKYSFFSIFQTSDCDSM